MRADRLLAILLLLQGRGKMTAQALAQELEVSRRTILRDLDALSIAGIPVYASGGHGGGIALDERYRTSLTGFDIAELRALFASGNTLLLDEIGLGDAAERSQLKLYAALSAQQKTLVEQIRQRIYIDPTWWWHNDHPQQLWTDLQQAVFGNHRIKAIYENYKGEIVERSLEPYSLVAKGSSWYLIGRRDNEFRIYRISRFHQVKILDSSFQRVNDFNLPEFWKIHISEFTEAVSHYKCIIRIQSDQMNFIQRLLPGRFQALNQRDERGWITLQVSLESLDLAKMLVFNLGKQVEVIEPLELLDAVHAAAREILAMDQK